MNHRSLAAMIAVLAITCLTPALALRAESGPARGGHGANVDTASHPRWPAGPAGILDDPST